MSLPAGGPILSAQKIRMAAQPILVADRNEDGTPIVTLRRNGDRISEIQIRCHCGAMIVLDCEYTDTVHADSARIDPAFTTA